MHCCHLRPPIPALPTTWTWTNHRDPSLSAATNMQSAAAKRTGSQIPSQTTRDRTRRNGLKLQQEGLGMEGTLEGRWTWLKLGNSRHGTCWEIANPMTTSSSRTSQVTTAELAFRCLTVTFTGAEGLSARRESRAFTGAGGTVRARKGAQKDLPRGPVWICDLEIAGTPGLSSQEVLGDVSREYELHSTRVQTNREEI